MRRLLGLILLLGLIGCGGPKASDVPSGAQPTASASESWYERTRSGTFQLGSVLSTIQEAFEASETSTKAAKGDAKALWADVTDALDTAGASLEPFTEFNLSESDFDKDFVAQDDKRLKAIEAANDALHPLDDAAEALGELSDGQQVLELVRLAQDDLKEAIETLGGKVEEDEGTDPGPTN